MYFTKKLLKISLYFSEAIKKEGDRLKAEAENMAPIIVGTHSIECVGFPTMNDGKVKSILAGNNLMSRCYLCLSGMTTHNFHLSKRRSKHFKVKNKEALKYGFSPLHVRLRSLEWFLKCKTYSDFQYHEARYVKFSVTNFLTFVHFFYFRGDINKGLVAAQKLVLQQKFKDAFGVRLWKPKPGGGTYMDGRCSKLAFSDPEKFSEIIGKN